MKKEFSRDRLRLWLTVGLATASFIIYAATALMVHRGQRNDFIPERSSIAAAVSNVAYGAPLGKVYAGVLAQVLDFTVPLEQTLVLASSQEVPRGALNGATADGNGIGYIVVTSLSMRLLGLHTTSIVVFMLALMGLSALAFLWRFPDRFALVLVLYFTSLTIMLFTPLTWNHDYLLNITIGGIRYFSLVGILPAFHLLLDCADTRGAGPRWIGRGLAPMAIQIVVLVLAVLVRNSAAALIMAIPTGCLLIAWKRRREIGARAKVLRKLAGMAVVGAVFVGFLMLSVSSNYVTEGRFTETVWHRITLSLGVSPEWPFGNVREMFDCKRYIPEGIVANSEDRNGHCMWWDYATRHNIPPDIAVTMTYSREYDKALREAFFKIARAYPLETLRTFFYYKPLFIVSSIEKSLDLKFSGIQPILVWLFGAAVVDWLGFALVSSLSPSSADEKLLAGMTFLLAGFTTLPYLAVWALPHTSADLLLLCFFGVGLAGVAIIEKLRYRIARTTLGR